MPLWIPQLARGLAAVALGVTITLSLDHSPRFGLVAFGVFAVVAGAIGLAADVRGTIAGATRVLFAVASGATLVAGIIALALADGGVPVLVPLVAGWAAVAGAAELIAGIRTRRREPAARDWIIVGTATVLLAVVFLLVPGDLAEAFAGEKGNSGVLTSSIVLVGSLGAWAVVTGVVQLISAVSLRPARSADS